MYTPKNKTEPYFRYCSIPNIPISQWPEESVNSCPWYYGDGSYDENRYPQHIRNATIKTDCFPHLSENYCVSRISDNGRPQSNKKGVCREVNQIIPILRRNSVGEQYSVYFESVVVGFRCEMIQTSFAPLPTGQQIGKRQRRETEVKSQSYRTRRLRM